MISRRASASLPLVLFLAARLSAADPSPATPSPTTPVVPTVIESGALESVGTAKDTTFTFSQGVQVTATNMLLTCDTLVVVARRTGDAAATLGKQEKFKSFVATGRVRIVQGDREATADRAEVFPEDDKVILTGNPVTVRSEKEGWTQTGPEAKLLRGERRAIFESKDGVRPRTTLPDLKDLGYDKVPEKKKPAAAPAAPGTTSAETPAPPTITVPIPPPKP